jgi:hypothetical protein
MAQLTAHDPKTLDSKSLHKRRKFFFLKGAWPGKRNFLILLKYLGMLIAQEGLKVHPNNPIKTLPYQPKQNLLNRLIYQPKDSAAFGSKFSTESKFRN